LAYRWARAPTGRREAPPDDKLRGQSVALAAAESKVRAPQKAFAALDRLLREHLLELAKPEPMP